MRPGDPKPETTSASDVTAFFAIQNLGAPPLPADVVQGMQAHGPDCFASTDLQEDWRSGALIRDVAARWLDAGCTHRGARCEFTGSGIRSNFFQLAFETPRCGLFVAKLVSSALGDGEVNQLRLEGTVGLMRHLMTAIEAAKHWPEGKRLALLDDDREGIVRWGWIADKGAKPGDLSFDDMGWISALMSVEKLAEPGK